MEAGVIDAATGARISAFESGLDQKETLRWPVFLAMIFAGILFAAGITLFVAAHWEQLSPAFQFSLMIALAGLFHVGGALLGRRFPALATTLHAVGTATLGAAIFLTAQIFNLQENWSTGILLWAIGAAAGYFLLQDSPQAALLALLTPAWLVGRWLVTTEHLSGGARITATGLILTAICYLSARKNDEPGVVRRTLVWIGGIAVLPCVGIAIGLASEERFLFGFQGRPRISDQAATIGWIVAIATPLLVAWFLRRGEIWIQVLWTAWALGLVQCASLATSYANQKFEQHLGATSALYAMCAIGSIGLVLWGLRDNRKERVNLGVAGFAIAVLFFYFDSFMDKLDRSASLLILGLICLAGGYALEVMRRRLMTRMETGK